MASVALLLLHCSVAIKCRLNGGPMCLECNYKAKTARNELGECKDPDEVGRWGVPSARAYGLLLGWVSHRLPDSARADGNLADPAGQLGMLDEHSNKSQHNPGA